MTEEKKKGLSPLVWVAIGCGGILILAFVIMSAGVWFGAKKIKDVAQRMEDNPAKTAAELVVKMNPELELVESDEESGTLTIRYKESGEVATFDYSDIQEGRFSFETAEGKMSIDATGGEEGGLVTWESEEGQGQWAMGDDAGGPPSWIPAYPGVSDIDSTFAATAQGTDSGAYSFETSDSPGEVFAFYHNRLESEGFAIGENTTSEGGAVTGGMLSATSEDDGRELVVIVSAAGAVSQVSVQYRSPS